jgi:hypothetical protein
MPSPGPGPPRPLTSLSFCRSPPVHSSVTSCTSSPDSKHPSSRTALGQSCGREGARPPAPGGLPRLLRFADRGRRAACRRRQLQNPPQATARLGAPPSNARRQAGPLLVQAAPPARAHSAAGQPARACEGSAHLQLVQDANLLDQLLQGALPRQLAALLGHDLDRHLQGCRRRDAQELAQGWLLYACGAAPNLSVTTLHQNLPGWARRALSPLLPLLGVVRAAAAAAPGMATGRRRHGHN